MTDLTEQMKIGERLRFEMIQADRAYHDYLWSHPELNNARNAATLAQADAQPEPSVRVSAIERLIINWVGITGGVYASAPEYSRGYDNGVNQCASMLRDLIQREKPL